MARRQRSEATPRRVSTNIETRTSVRFHFLPTWYLHLMDLRISRLMSPDVCGPRWTVVGRAPVAGLPGVAKVRK